MKADFVAAMAVLLSTASGETDKLSLQSVGTDLVSVGTVCRVVHQTPRVSNLLC